jgi:aryl-alcohol dehydrogenase-like predicted oxidoreductase
MKLPDGRYFQFTRDLSICRLLNGMWQVSGAHGNIEPEAAVQSMFTYLDSGLITWDLADHYGPAEDFIGEFRRRLTSSRGYEALSGIQAFTKWVPSPGPMTEKLVEVNVDLSLRRMNVESIDLLQFHWWEYQDENYLDALAHLSQLRRRGKIKYLGLTNFDTEHMKRVIEQGFDVVSNQVQFSLIDRRPEVQMVQYCREHDIRLLAYGTLCGGLMSEKYLGQPEPTHQALNTVSLRKYKQMIDVWGGWDLFQELLAILKLIGDKHDVSVANVAVRYVLERPAVAGAIIGARLGVSDHRDGNLLVFEFALDSDDLNRIETVLVKSQDLYHRIGDCGDEYRR